MTGLLQLLTTVWNSGKTGATLFRLSESETYVEEYFDDGKGHSGAFTHKTTSITPSLFDKARSQCYIKGKLEPGYVSTREFLITEEGKRSHYERWEIVKGVLRRIGNGEKVYASDLTVLTGQARHSDTTGLAEDILDHYVHERTIETCVEGDKKYYVARKREL
ncbi:MAG TPA: hypothetical protein VM103_00905 [Candidatus Paceibacterota bacterium]|nr:hypothetical protein [Candidatus Paceibacterota bacterium]